MGRTFRKAGFSVDHGSFYEDPQEQVPREIDVLARRMVRYREGGMLHVEVVLECKVSLDHPWVLFGQPDEPLGLHPTHRGIWNRYGQSWLQQMEAAGETAKAPLLIPDQFAAHAMAMAFGGDKDAQAQGKRPDRTFQAVTVAIKAAHARALASERTSGWGLRAVYFPVVALRGQLFDAHLDEHGEVVVRQVTHGQLLWHAPDESPSGIRPVLVDIVTDEHLEKFAADSAISADHLLSQTDAALAADPTDIGIY